MWKLFKLKACVWAQSLRQRGFPRRLTILISTLRYSLNPRIKNDQVDLYVAKARVRVEYQEPDALRGGRM